MRIAGLRGEVKVYRVVFWRFEINIPLALRLKCFVVIYQIHYLVIYCVV